MTMRLHTFTDPDLEALWGELHGLRLAHERIASALELALQEPAPPAADQGPACLHPADQRIDFGFTAGEADWQCKACGYRSVTPIAEEERV